MQAIALMSYLAETHGIWGPFLVITPVSTLHNWQQEIMKFCPDLKPLPYWGNQNDRKILRKFWSRKKLYTKDAPFHVLITSYQLVLTDQSYFQKVKWQYMILDEAQAIKSSSSLRWTTLLKMNCRNRLLLTGTPIQNSMQELWALLHFIMPTLFDSHEEFSDWFSRDIETHAQDRGTLNEHQLRRLHMILKPFMLRRIKRDVEHELGEKIELEVKCSLASRQRKMYQGLKQKLSLADLLDKVTSLNESESAESLMNLVMQFRKVCNHPELFERADVVSPFQVVRPLDIRPIVLSRSEDIAIIQPIAKASLTFVLPKKMYRFGLLLENVGPETPAAWKRKNFRNRFSIWNEENISRSMIPQSDAEATSLTSRTFSFLRFIDMSPRELSLMVTTDIIHRWIYHLLIRERPQKWGSMYSLFAEDRNENVPPSTYGKFLIQPLESPTALWRCRGSGPLNELTSFYERGLSESIICRLNPAFMLGALSAPPELICNDMSFMIEQQQRNNNPVLRALLSGVIGFLPGGRTNRRNDVYFAVSELIKGEGMVGRPENKQGFSNIWVPCTF